MKNLILLLVLIPFLAFSQEIETNTSKKGVFFSVKSGIDIAHFTDSYNYYDLGSGINAEIGLAYQLSSGFGLGLDYHIIRTNPISSISSSLAYDVVGASPRVVSIADKKMLRHHLFIGPQYQANFGKFGAILYLRGGYSYLNGGDLAAFTLDPLTQTDDYHLLFSGFKGFEPAFKGGIDLSFAVTNRLQITLGAYHLRYLSVTPDQSIDINSIGDVGLIYGSSVIDERSGSGIIVDEDAVVVREASCSTCSSTGVQLGFRYRFGGLSPKKSTRGNTCPDDEHKVFVTVKDGPSGQVIPQADVVIYDMDGRIQGTAKSNEFGIANLGTLPHGNYSIEGKVYGLQTSSSSITISEFIAGQNIEKTILYEDLRFILKGRTINKANMNSEPGVLVNLRNTGTQKMEQNTSNGKGEFAFKLDKNSSYEISGIKENRLSDINRASTMGLTRSTTLFVELQLGFDNFDCGRGTVLDIKYEYDSYELLPESRFELNRVVQYLKDHPNSKIELSSHTDSRGTAEYNQQLSLQRARSASNYISSQGISTNRIIAQGYGESKLLNQCKDGSNCSEEEHRINRRTEAKLLCN